MRNIFAGCSVPEKINVVGYTSLPLFSRTIVCVSNNFGATSLKYLHFWSQRGKLDKSITYGTTQSRIFMEDSCVGYFQFNYI